MNTVKRIKVMLATEGTYPYYHGNISTWCDVLIKKLNNLDYYIYSIATDPYVTQKFTLPETAGAIKVPLWETEDAGEHLHLSFSQIHHLKKHTTERVIETDFLPIFQTFIEEILKLDKDPWRFAYSLYNMYTYFREYDYTSSFKAHAAWQIFKDNVLHYASYSKNNFPLPSLADLIQSMGWLYRFFTPLNTPVPEVDLSHSTAAAFCGIPCIIAKFAKGTPYLLTEHDVYLKEQYLTAGRSGFSPYLKTFYMRLIHSVVSMNYTIADQVSPVCPGFSGWERNFGVNPEKIKVIYSGVDNSKFSPPAQPPENNCPIVATVTRIDPGKDIITLLRTADIVRKSVPDVQFKVYGSVTDREYYEECLDIHEELALDTNFVFLETANDVANVLRQADIVAFSTVTDAFPYSVVEAMMSGKAIVTTDTGEVSEVLGDSGLIVPPGKPEAFAQALLTLLQDAGLKQSLEERTHQRALEHFTLGKALDLYLKTYRKLTFTTVQSGDRLLRQQKLLTEKGYALLEFGYWTEAIDQFNQAIKVAPSAPIVPVLFADIAAAYTELGLFETANLNFEKAKLMIQLSEDWIA